MGLVSETNVQPRLVESGVSNKPSPDEAARHVQRGRLLPGAGRTFGGAAELFSGCSSPKRPAGTPGGGAVTINHLFGQTVIKDFLPGACPRRQANPFQYR